ncbi:MAG: hypothetical protein NTW49_07805 [Bacteroidia bacterium]|nr:hypothetical protein [Bacteroidia bacterium]
MTQKEKPHITTPTRFAGYKDHVIDLLKRVCTVSVETMKIMREMEKRAAGQPGNG